MDESPRLKRKQERRKDNIKSTDGEAAIFKTEMGQIPICCLENEILGTEMDKEGS